MESLSLLCCFHFSFVSLCLCCLFSFLFLSESVLFPANPSRSRRIASKRRGREGEIGQANQQKRTQIRDLYSFLLLSVYVLLCLVSWQSYFALCFFFPAVVIAKCSKRSDLICCVSFARNWRVFLYFIAFTFPLSLFAFVVSCPFYFFLSLYCFPPILPGAEGLLQNVEGEKVKSDKQINEREHK